MIRSIVNEVYGLFVDDGLLAAALLAWVAVNGIARLLVSSSPPQIMAPVFAFGCIAILLVVTARATPKR